VFFRFFSIQPLHICVFFTFHTHHSSRKTYLVKITLCIYNKITTPINQHNTYKLLPLQTFFYKKRLLNKNNLFTLITCIIFSYWLKDGLEFSLNFIINPLIASTSSCSNLNNTSGSLSNRINGEIK